MTKEKWYELFMMDWRIILLLPESKWKKCLSLSFRRSSSDLFIWFICFSGLILAQRSHRIFHTRICDTQATHKVRAPRHAAMFCNVDAEMLICYWSCGGGRGLACYRNADRTPPGEAGLHGKPAATEPCALPSDLAAQIPGIRGATMGRIQYLFD